MTSSRQSKEQLITIANELPAITYVIDQLEAFGNEIGIDVGAIQRFSIVLDELLNNTISYGFEDGEKAEIQIRMVWTPPEFEITIEDEGKHFDPIGSGPPNTSADIDERDIGGLGIHIIKNIMDEFHYRRLGVRNIISVRKRIQA